MVKCCKVLTCLLCFYVLQTAYGSKVVGPNKSPAWRRLRRGTGQLVTYDKFGIPRFFGGAGSRSFDTSFPVAQRLNALVKKSQKSKDIQFDDVTSVADTTSSTVAATTTTTTTATTTTPTVSVIQSESSQKDELITRQLLSIDRSSLLIDPIDPAGSPADATALAESDTSSGGDSGVDAANSTAETASSTSTTTTTIQPSTLAPSKATVPSFAPVIRENESFDEQQFTLLAVAGTTVAGAVAAVGSEQSGNSYRDGRGCVCTCPPSTPFPQKPTPPSEACAYGNCKGGSSSGGYGGQPNAPSQPGYGGSKPSYGNDDFYFGPPLRPEQTASEYKSPSGSYGAAPGGSYGQPPGTNVQPPSGRYGQAPGTNAQPPSGAYGQQPGANVKPPNDNYNQPSGGNGQSPGGSYGQPPAGGYDLPPKKSSETPGTYAQLPPSYGKK